MVKKTAACLMPFVFILMPIYADAGCESLDNFQSVSGSAHCLASKTFSPLSGSAKTIAVVLHGDLSGGDIEYPVLGVCRLW